MSGTDEFFAYARERYLIKQRRENGEPFPWTEDEVLQAYRFCHVFREDDRVTIWFRENIRDLVNAEAQVIVDRIESQEGKTKTGPPIRQLDRVVYATAGFRWFTREDVGERIASILTVHGWSSKMVKQRLKNWPPPLVTGAYMMTSPHGMNKLDGICHAMDLLKAAAPDEGWGRYLRSLQSLEEAHNALLAVDFLGGFRAYEIITDLFHTCILSNARDAMTWAHPGPGAARGIEWIIAQKLGRSKEEYAEMLGVMQKLLHYSTIPKLWPKEWPRWDMRTVEHTLCEFDKFKRGHTGGRLKRRYRHAES